MKIHCIEGLFSYYARPLTKAVQSLNLGVEIVTYPWAIEDIEVDEGDVVLMHSFGLKVIEDILFLIKKYKMQNLTVFILDGRMPWLGGPFKGKIEKEWKDRFFNYYQTGNLQGHPIDGATNTKVEMTGLFRHYRMPSNPAFLFKLMEVVKSAKP